MDHIAIVLQYILYAHACYFLDKCGLLALWEYTMYEDFTTKIKGHTLRILDMVVE